MLQEYAKVVQPGVRFACLPIYAVNANHLFCFLMASVLLDVRLGIIVMAVHASYALLDAQVVSPKLYVKDV